MKFLLVFVVAAVPAATKPSDAIPAAECVAR
jgi:hypothetical protein